MLRLMGARCWVQVDTEIWSTSFSAGQIRGMELMICSTLDWRLHCATPADFLDCLLCLANVGRRPDGTLLAGGRPAARVRSMAHTLIFQMLAGDRQLEQCSGNNVTMQLAARKLALWVGNILRSTVLCRQLFVLQQLQTPTRWRSGRPAWPRRPSLQRCARATATASSLGRPTAASPCTSTRSAACA
jgi:hypothetical protein